MCIHGSLHFVDLLPGVQDISMSIAHMRGPSDHYVAVLLPRKGHDLPKPGEVLVVSGRIFGTRQLGRALAGLERHSDPPFRGQLIRAGVSRLTGASIAGLVVGAMGVFVFTVALRHWLGERRRFREEAKA